MIKEQNKTSLCQGGNNEHSPVYVGLKIGANPLNRLYEYMLPSTIYLPVLSYS